MDMQPVLAPEAFRAATYIVSKARIDAKFKRSGKTRRGVKCTPPNKKCGDRCIRPNWNCRLTGGGLDSHSKVVEFDPVGGTGAIIRGVKNVAEGYQKRNPEQITRGIKGVERGIVKITPGDTVDQKQRFRKRVQAVGNIAFFGIATALVAGSTHRALKGSFEGYRTGLGADIDRASALAVQRVVDGWDQGVERVGLSRLFGTGRAQIQGAGATAASRIARQGTLSDISEARLSQPPRSSNILQTRSRLRGSSFGTGALNSLDVQARTEKWTQSQWEARKIETLYGLRENGRSVFSAPAAHEMLASQWGFQLPPRTLRETGRITETSMVRYRLLPDAIGQLHTDLKTDMLRRRLPMTNTGITEYANQLLRENPNLIKGAPNPTARRRLEQEFRSRLREVTLATTSAQQRTVANNAYTRTVSYFDDYFTRSAQALTVNEGGRTRLAPVNPNSPYGDAMVGLSKFHYGQSRGARPRNRDAASFLNSIYFHTRIQNSSEPYNLRTSTNAIKYASSLAGVEIRSAEEALSWFRTNGYNVRIPTTRRRRTDATDTNRGKPCGKSHIPKAHKCHTEGGATASPAAATPGLADKHDKAYHTRRVASLAARFGAIGGGAVLAYVAGREAIKEVKQGPLSADLDNVRDLTYVALTGAIISSAAVGSIKREKVTTFDSDQLVDRYETLKKEKDVDPKVVTQLQTFIKDADIDSQRVSTKLIIGGLAGYFDTAKPDRIHITGEGLTVSGAGTTYTKGVDNYMRYRAKASASIITQNDKTTIDKYQRNFSASSWINSKEGKADYLIAHEIAHAIHYRGKFATPKAVVVNGKRYEGADLQRELARSTSYYGQSDLFKKSNSTTNYYDQGNRLETYAENFALYVGNSRSMKEYFPVSYEWTRQTTEYALKQKPKVRARPFLDVVSDLSKGAQQFEPQRLRSRRDSPEDDARILQLLRQMQSVATEGDTTKAMAIFAEAQQFPQDVRFMFGSLLETAFLYASIEDEDRTDAAGEKRLGKPCGKSHIPKAHKCHAQGAGPALKTVAKAALVAVAVAGGAALALRIRSNYAPSPGFDPTHGLDVNDPLFARNHYELIRAKARPYSATEMSEQIRSIADDPEVVKSNIQKCAAWIEARKIGLDPNALEKGAFTQFRNKVAANRNIAGAYYPGLDDQIWIRRRGRLDGWTADTSKAAIRGTNDTLDAIRDRQTSDADAVSLKYYSSTMGAGMEHRSGQDLMTYIHEVGHSVHYRATKYSEAPVSTVVNGKFRRIDPKSPEFRAQLRQVQTDYGRSNLKEAFAEAHVAYVFSGRRLRREAPLVHGWIDFMYDQALQNQRQGKIK